MLLIPFSNIKIKAYLQILKNWTQFFPYLFFQILKKFNNNLHKNHYTNNSCKNHYKHKAKYIITACIPIIIIKKKFVFFSLQYIRMNGNSINFNNKNIEKGDFYNKNKKILNIDDVDVNKILVSKKKNNMVNIIHLNI